MIKLGVIGYGKRINSIVGLLLENGECVVAAIADTDCESVKRRFPALSEKIRYYSDAEAMLKREALDGVLVGTRCSSHTKYAVLAAKYRLPLFLEKPVCTTYEDLLRLVEILPEMNTKTVVSFPLRTALVVEKVKKIVNSDRIGKLSQIQAYNNVGYGGNYYHKWYKDVGETGGMFLQKATHDLDYISYVTGLKPKRVCAMKAQAIYGGDRDPGLRCRDCPDVADCPETVIVEKAKNEVEIYDNCSFTRDIGVEDSGSVIVEYDSGIHTVYTQNFVTRNGAARRGATFIGYKGTVTFDFYSGEIRIYDHFTDNSELITVEDDGSHFGGDKYLADGFVEIIKNGASSPSSLYDGIISAATCLAARESSEKGIFVDINV